MRKNRSKDQAFTKQGIRNLDPPGNHRRRPAVCAHEWSRPYVEDRYADVPEIVRECNKCGEVRHFGFEGD